MNRFLHKLTAALLTASIAMSLPLGVFADSADRPGKKAAQGAKQEQHVSNFSKEQTYEQLNGRWTGGFRTPLTEMTYFVDPVEMNFSGDSDGSVLYLTIDSYVANYTYPNQWTVGPGYLRFSVNERAWFAEIDLTLSDDGRTLNGTYTQYGIQNPLTLTKVSDEPKDFSETPRFVFEKEPGETWYSRLSQYPSFTTGGSIPFTYELYAGGKLQPLLNSAPFEQAYYHADVHDISIMKALMDTLCDAYPHDGASGMPEQLDSISIMNYAKQQGGIECRGLSTMLADVLRSFGIPAKVIMCIPSTEPCEECHVLVHAYSYDLQQWVMLDPTYRLMLKNEEGQYVSLPMLRDALIHDTPLYANDDAGHNREPFSMEYYRAYMTKNCFRFSTPTAAKFGGAGEQSNRVWMLAPKDYRVPYLYSRPETVTTSAEAFWAAP